MQREKKKKKRKNQVYQKMQTRLVQFKTISDAHVKASMSDSYGEFHLRLSRRRLRFRVDRVVLSRCRRDSPSEIRKQTDRGDQGEIFRGKAKERKKEEKKKKKLDARETVDHAQRPSSIQLSGGKTDRNIPARCL